MKRAELNKGKNILQYMIDRVGSILQNILQNRSLHYSFYYTTEPPHRALYPLLRYLLFFINKVTSIGIQNALFILALFVLLLFYWKEAKQYNSPDPLE